MAWTPTEPAAGIAASLLDDHVRTNNSAIDAVFGDQLLAAVEQTATIAEVNQLDGVTVGGNAAGDILTTDDTQDVSGKTSTDGFRVTGGSLAIAPAAGSEAQITGSSVAETEIAIYAGGYTAFESSGAIKIRSKDSTDPGTVSIYGTNGTTAVQGLKVLTDGTTNLPVGLEVGGVAVTATPAEINAAANGIGVTIPRAKMVDMGTWDMDATENVSVAHGLTASKIVGVTAKVRDDLGNYFQLPYSANYTEVDARVYWTATNLNTYRRGSGYFDSTDFNDTASSRGMFIVFYID